MAKRGADRLPSAKRSHASSADELDRSWSDEDYRPSSQEQNQGVDPWEFSTPQSGDANRRGESIRTVRSVAIGVQDELPFLPPAHSMPSFVSPVGLASPDPEPAGETAKPVGGFFKQQDTDSADASYPEGEVPSQLGEGFEDELEPGDIDLSDIDHGLTAETADPDEDLFEEENADSVDVDYLEGESDFNDVSLPDFDLSLAARTTDVVDGFFEHEDTGYADADNPEGEVPSQLGEEFDYELELDDVDLPDFDPSLHLPPPLPFEDDSALRHAREKAAAMVRVLALHSTGDVASALHYMTEFFLEFQHHATYRAIERLVWEGLDVETLQVMLELREVWQDRAAWSEPLRATDRSWRRYSTSLSWEFAYQICRSRWQYPPDQMIDDDWFSEWCRQTDTDGHAIRDFGSWVREKVTSRDFLVSTFDFVDEEQPAWKSAVNPLRARGVLSIDTVLPLTTGRWGP